MPQGVAASLAAPQNISKCPREAERPRWRAGLFIHPPRVSQAPVSRRVTAGKPVTAEPGTTLRGSYQDETVTFGGVHEGATGPLNTIQSDFKWEERNVNICGYAHT